MSNTQKIKRALGERDAERRAQREANMARRDPADELTTCLDVLAQWADNAADLSDEQATALWQTVELGLMLMAEHARLLELLGQQQQYVASVRQAVQQQEIEARPSHLVLPGDNGFKVLS